MKLSFDERSHLKPYGKNELELNEFRNIFVDSFDSDSTRHMIYANFEKYIIEFKEEVSSNFKVWINGSFVTNRINPKDIDIVILLEHKTAIEKVDILQRKFLNRESLKVFRIDAYIVRTFSEDHKEYSNTRSDLLYWEHWFSNSKKNRDKKRFPKGFVELSFEHK